MLKYKTMLTYSSISTFSNLWKLNTKVLLSILITTVNNILTIDKLFSNSIIKTFKNLFICSQIKKYRYIRRNNSRNILMFK